MVRSITVTSVVDAVVNDLKRLVLDKELPPGTALTENDVAERYDVARATAKAAIERLVSDKVLDRSNYKTARVVMLGPNDVRDIYNSRIYLESEVLRRLAKLRRYPAESRAANEEIRSMWSQGVWDITEPDMRFHTSLVAYLKSPRTKRMYQSLAFEVRLCMSQLQGTQRLSPEIIIAEHARLLDFIEQGDGAGASALLDEHLSRARELLAGSLGGVSGPEAFVSSSALVAD
ncbi:MAG: GntR family transcriptional regulator [Propionibacteriaceae bacterium]|jgi:DNA-binding GntR family transcriptional regulator|nr:GntR family transcriptional regulator [Propionibacteriaceae bacterium]